MNANSYKSNVHQIPMNRQAFKYRLYPSQKQEGRLFSDFETCKQVWNELLDYNKNFYRRTGKRISKAGYDHFTSGKIKDVYSQVTQNVAERLDLAFDSFFRRLKERKAGKKVKPGFPRYKSKVSSITYPQKGFKFLSEKKLSVSKIGNIQIILHRTPKGQIKTLTIKRNKANQWFAYFSCELETQPIVHPQKDSKIGIDVGLESFATLSNGTKIENPRFLLKSEKRLKHLNRKFSKKKKGSKNRQKARLPLAKQHLKVTNQRQDFQHKLAKTLISQFATISVEHLNIANMVQNHRLAKSISDASWGNFKRILSYKAVIGGGELIEVNPRNTSKTCSGCGTVLEELKLKERTFNCPTCGLNLDRDHNAAINISGRAGLARTYTPVEIGPLHFPKREPASSLVESGTTRNTPIHKKGMVLLEAHTL